MTKIKVCGITSREEAQFVASLGPDAIGFVFAESKRRVKPELVKEVVSALPPFIQKVGVFVNEDIEKVREVYHTCGLSMVQLHGDESPDYCAALNLPIIKAIAVKNEAEVKRAAEYKVQAILLDTFIPGMPGGTGRCFSWEMVTNYQGPPLIVAGGLHADNVTEAIKRLRPYAVDVSSGVESNGKKDFQKVKDFIQNIRRLEL